MQERQIAVPPYVPYRTFQTFLEFLQDGIPARIDRSVWGSRFSGSSGTQLMTALKVLQRFLLLQGLVAVLVYVAEKVDEHEPD